MFVAAAALVGVASQLDWDRVDGLGTPHAWFLLLVAAGLHLLTLPLKAAAWRAVLAASLTPAAGLSIRKILPPVMVGAILNLALAGRVGEAARVLLLHGRLGRDGHRAGLSVVVGSAITESMVSTAAWVGLVLMAGIVVPLPTSTWLVVGAVGTLWFLVVLAAVRGWGAPSSDGPARGVLARSLKWGRGVWGHIVVGHRSLCHRATVAPLLMATVGGWLAQLACVYAALRAFDLTGGWSAATLVLVSLSVAQTIPLLPGNVGVFEAAVALPLVASFAVPASTAVAVGVVLHIVQSAPVALAGAVALSREGQGLATIVGTARRLPRRSQVVA
ncbi:MAG: lysylphosphatidylglycerol synthase transmembrane domain-containing protein [Thermoleophilia bacterium]